jgi:hypothetical protein
MAKLLLKKSTIVLKRVLETMSTAPVVLKEV